MTDHENELLRLRAELYKAATRYALASGFDECMRAACALEDAADAWACRNVEVEDDVQTLHTT